MFQMMAQCRPVPNFTLFTVYMQHIINETCELNSPTPQLGYVKEMPHLPNARRTTRKITTIGVNMIVVHALPQYVTS